MPLAQPPPTSVLPPAPMVHAPPPQLSTPVAQLHLISGSGVSGITIHVSAIPDSAAGPPDTVSTDTVQVVSLPTNSASHLPPTPPQPPLPPVQSTPLSDLRATEDPSSSSWKALVAALGEGPLYRHKWEWTNGTWLPYYRYLPVHSITDVWTEWSSGLDGHLPVRDWRSNGARSGGGTSPVSGPKTADERKSLSLSPPCQIRGGGASPWQSASCGRHMSQPISPAHFWTI